MFKSQLEDVFGFKLVTTYDSNDLAGVKRTISVYQKVIELTFDDDQQMSTDFIPMPEIKPTEA